MSARAFSSDEARAYVHAPHSGSDKYSRGVVGFVTGSVNFPGAALLGIDGALHAGIGMVRYVGPEVVGAAVLQHRPEVVLGDARAQAWVVGSGVTGGDAAQLAAAAHVLDEARPAVVDAGALNLLSRHARGLVIATPHAGELAQLLGVSRAAVEAEPEDFVTLAARFLGVTVVLKGATTYIAGEGGCVRLEAPTSWLAVAGAGDVLAGIMGAILASHCAASPGVTAEGNVPDGESTDTGSAGVTETDLVAIAATAVWIHSEAAQRASRGGPFVLAELVSQIPHVIAGLVAPESD
ncbi:MAG: NAD(P)H-hydrate dehydratase [Microbacteriaceae bacterium]